MYPKTGDRVRYYDYVFGEYREAVLTSSTTFKYCTAIRDDGVVLDELLSRIVEKID